jgi:sugar phosphate permease
MVTPRKLDILKRMSSDAVADGTSNLARYLQLGVLVLAGGAIYPLLYLRQNFEVSMLEAFAITNTELGRCYSMLGILFFLTYLPSGWVADRFKPRNLLTFSLFATGLLGLWYWTLPGFTSLQIIYAGWGITTGLTFWAALIKETNLIAYHDEQGRFFGILEGGRGVVEAILGSIAVGGFAWLLSNTDASTPEALRQVIMMYVVVLLVMAPIVYLALGESHPGDAVTHDDPPVHETRHQDTFREALLILKRREVWLAAICIVSGYSLYYATFSFAGFLQTELALSAVVVGWITVGRLWMRPIGAIASGFIADRFQVERTLGVILILTSIGLFSMVLLPAGAGVALVLPVVLLVGALTFAVRGIYWSTLDDCNVPLEVRGLAIGIISLIGYSPEIFIPLINGYLVETYPGRLGYGLYYGIVAIMGLIGAGAAFMLAYPRRR